MTSQPRPTGRHDFHVGIVCALPHEADAVALLFDCFWDSDDETPLDRAVGDTNAYMAGRIGQHDVILVVLPNIGTSAAAAAAASFRSSYSGLKLMFLVGICGGVPEVAGQDVFLGDVVVSKSIVRYDYGRQYPESFQVKTSINDSLGRASKSIRSILAKLEMEINRERLQAQAGKHLNTLQAALLRKRWRRDYRYPGVAQDQLFERDYVHKHHTACGLCAKEPAPFCESASLALCNDLSCDESRLVRREHHLDGEKYEPNIFVGCIGSGNAVMKSGRDRDRIAQAHGCIAFEMEGAGAWEEIPSIVVKGICDYSDSHKNKRWQNFAAATAACVTRAILERHVPSDDGATASASPEQDNSTLPIEYPSPRAAANSTELIGVATVQVVGESFLGIRSDMELGSCKGMYITSS